MEFKFDPFPPLIHPSIVCKKMESGGENLKLHAYVWESFYTQRVIWALKIKGIEYDRVDESYLPPGESYLTYLYNPAHKRTPMLVHNGKPLTGSLVIIEYIDETWKHEPLLPSDPYERAKARFWAKFSDDKVFFVFPVRSEFES